MTPSTTVSTSDYARKLKDPRWLRKKADILIRDGNQCKFCRTDDRHLQVRFVIHRGIDPWEYRDDELETVCVDCIALRTKVIDELIDSLRWTIRDTTNGDLPRVARTVLEAAKLSSR